MQRGLSPFPELKTARLLLRRISGADELAILFLRSDPTVNKYIIRERIKRPEEAAEFISRVDKDITQGRCIYWAICMADHPNPVGVICLWNFTEDRLTAELGYELMPAFQRQGIMQEAVESVLQFGFEEIFLERIEAFTHKKNKNSIKLLKKNGFMLMNGRRDTNNAFNIIFSLCRTAFK